MTAQEILKLVNENPAFHLATVEGDQPRVRGMLLYRADENGFIFHTASTKDVFAQIKQSEDEIKKDLRTFNLSIVECKY